MAICETCGNVILFGAKQHSGKKYCSAGCLRTGKATEKSRALASKRARPSTDGADDGPVNAPIACFGSSCATCNETILFGGKKYAGAYFCNGECAEAGRISVAAEEIPLADAQLIARRLHRGPCPQCAGRGPVDVHLSHEIWSALVITRWESILHLVCRGCALKHQSSALLRNFVLGWWGLPWGVIVTPVQIIRNLIAIANPPNPELPSVQLIAHAKALLASGNEQLPKQKLID